MRVSVALTNKQKKKALPSSRGQQWRYYQLSMRSITIAIKTIKTVGAILTLKCSCSHKPFLYQKKTLFALLSHSVGIMVKLRFQTKTLNKHFVTEGKLSPAKKPLITKVKQLKSVMHSWIVKFHAHSRNITIKFFTQILLTISKNHKSGMTRIQALNYMIIICSVTLHIRTCNGGSCILATRWAESQCTDTISCVE